LPDDWLCHWGLGNNTWNRDINAYETIIDGSSSTGDPGDWDGAGGLGLPNVIAVPGGYMLTYDGRGSMGRGLGFATSPDGVVWTKDAGNPTLTPAGGETAWDNWYRGQVSVMLDGATYKMWYSGAGVNWQTGYATSADAHSWTIPSPNPVLPVNPSGSWDSTEADGPTVIKDGATYKMWYHGCDDSSNVCSIGYATSPDGTTWTKHPGNPVLTTSSGTWEYPNLIYWPRVIKTGTNAYVMYYSSNNQIGRVTSSDGIAWAKDANPVLAQDWEGNGVRGGSVLFDGSTYRMWFHASHPDGSRIGLATSPDGINWTMYPGNPVLTRGIPVTGGESTISIESGGNGGSLDGLTVTGAQACQEGAGGVTIHDADFTLSYVRLRNNDATNGCGGGGIGVIGGGADVTLEHSLVYENNANDGGGVMAWDAGTIHIIDTDIYSNTVYGWGGAGVEVMNLGASMTIADSHIYGNSGNSPGGGVYAKNFSSLAITNTVIENNIANGGDGGGMYIEEGTVQADHVQLIDNYAEGQGGGAWVASGALELTGSLVQGNTAGQQGGGLAHYGDLTLMDVEVLDNFANDGAGGIAVFDPNDGGQLNATNTVIASNQGTWGGGIAPFWRGHLTNVTIANNSCSACDSAGIQAPVDAQNSMHYITNTIVYFNNPGSIACNDQCEVAYSDIQGGATGTGNFDAPPMFLDTGQRDYRLQSGSPCIDTGTSQGAPDHDLEGDPRPVNTGFDVGADEYNAPYGQGPVVMRLLPTGTTQYVDQPFDVQIQVEAGVQPVDGAEAHLDFDPNKFQVSSIASGGVLPLVLQNTYDNVAGTVDFSAGTLNSTPSGTFPLAYVTFVPVGTSTGTNISFHILLPRESNVVYGGASVLHHLETASYTLRDDAILNASIGLQGRPNPPHARWVTPLTLKLYLQGQSTPSYTLTPTTDDSGHFSLEGIAPGTYTIVVKNSHTLANAKVATLAFGSNTLSLGTLKEGDADNNNCVAMVDFSILATTFGKSTGVPGYDDRADFDENATVNITDFSLLKASYGLCGNLPGAIAPAAEVKVPSGGEPPVGVSILVQPASRTVQVGESFTLSVVIDSGAQQVDGAEAHLNFDVDAVRIDQITGNTATFPFELQNAFSNTAGTLDYSAGTIANFPSGTTTLATIQLLALKPLTQSELQYIFQAPRLTDVTFGGASILTQHQNGQLTIVPSSNTLYLPSVTR
jgi:predicted GH43/DUF377 family glycosyl hydrolase